MRDADTLLDARKNAAVLSFGLLALVSVSKTLADTSEAESYTWSAELVRFDNAATTVTVKARMVEQADLEHVGALNAGDSAMLTWSGINTAAGIRAIERGSESSFDRMTMPVEYVASEMDGRYIVFEVPIPADDAAAIERLEPGQWVTATSPHHPNDSTEAVSSIRPYIDAAG